ncbi:MAG: 5-(carboxyamino)imidazole ribonucleotide mutase [Planctomycetota bacterium]
MGSDSDFPVLSETARVLESYGVAFDLRVCSAHRTPTEARELAVNARRSGVKVIVAAAGMAAHLAGAMAAQSTLPVIGVPLEGGLPGGVDALYSTVMMPGGVPVATMAVGKAGARNAGIFTVQILSLANPGLAQRLDEARITMAQEVAAKNQTVQHRLAELRREWK